MSMKVYTIAMSCALHLGLRMALFIKPAEGEALETPVAAGIIVYLSLMELIYQTELFPRSWRCLPSSIMFVLELMVTMFLGELCLIIFWTNVEEYTLNIVRDIAGKDEDTCRTIHGTLLIFLSTQIFVIVGFETRRMQKIGRLCSLVQQITENMISRKRIGHEHGVYEQAGGEVYEDDFYAQY